MFGGKMESAMAMVSSAVIGHVRASGRRTLRWSTVARRRRLSELRQRILLSVERGDGRATELQDIRLYVDSALINLGRGDSPRPMSRFLLSRFPLWFRGAHELMQRLAI